MVSARAKRILKRVWKAARPAVTAYGKQLAHAADADIARRMGGTSYGAYVPSISSFIPSNGSGLSLAGRGRRKRRRMRGAGCGVYGKMKLHSSKRRRRR
jgi:hypothetical protein